MNKTGGGDVVYRAQVFARGLHAPGFDVLEHEGKGRALPLLAGSLYLDFRGFLEGGKCVVAFELLLEGVDGYFDFRNDVGEGGIIFHVVVAHLRLRAPTVEKADEEIFCFALAHPGDVANGLQVSIAVLDVFFEGNELWSKAEANHEVRVFHVEFEVPPGGHGSTHGSEHVLIAMIS